MKRKELGKKSESLAKKVLISYGYKILDSNFTCKIGEIDIIAKDKNTLVFIEVRSKKNSNYGTPQETVNLKKQRKIKQVAQFYLNINNFCEVDCRFDVIAIVYEPKLNIKVIKDAFS